MFSLQKRLRIDKSKILLLKKISLFVFAFIFSYVIRIPQLYSPLNSIEYVTSHTLITVDLLYKNGLFLLRGSPRYTYESEADKNIPSIGGIKDKEGNYYYVSYPPLTFIFPYFVFKIFQVAPSPAGLRLINLALHFGCSFFVFLILNRIFDKKNKMSFLSSYGGFLFYLLSPGNLLFHTNYFFSDILAQFFFIGAVYFFIKAEETKKYGFYSAILMFLFVFLMAYTEWIGYLFGVVLIGYLLFIKKKPSGKINIIPAIILVLVACIAITILQYSSVSGTENLIGHLSQKYAVRSGYAESFARDSLSILNPKSYMNIIYFYYSYYFFPILLVAGMTFIYLVLKIKNILPPFDILSKKILILTFFPVLLHYLLFFNFNSLHSFSVLKTSFFLSILFGVLMEKIIHLTRYANILFILLLFLFSVYHPYEPAVDYQDDSYLLVGQLIQSTAREDELVFVCNDPSGYIQPQILYYAKRNILYCTDQKSVLDMMKHMNVKKAIVYHVDRKRNFQYFERI